MPRIEKNRKMERCISIFYPNRSYAKRCTYFILAHKTIAINAHSFTTCMNANKHPNACVRFFASVFELFCKFSYCTSGCCFLIQVVTILRYVLTWFIFNSSRFFYASSKSLHGIELSDSKKFCFDRTPIMTK